MHTYSTQKKHGKLLMYIVHALNDYDADNEVCGFRVYSFTSQVSHSMNMTTPISNVNDMRFMTINFGLTRISIAVNAIVHPFARLCAYAMLKLSALQLLNHSGNVAIIDLYPS